MNASISMGASAHNPLQALARLLPTGSPFPIAKPPKRHAKAANGLQLLLGSDGSITAYHHSNPVAWILPGYHHSTETGLRCEFVDVAYHRQTRHGINMETADFDTLPEAVSFINGVFGGAV
ncbi:hypothetical protein [Thiothrix winogradskyi]|uniref:Uncharacterized protein n=1 Tax=Thiothrix winogradskyi TaxID=96472 RepID=A0ABY3T3T4_9GAMM|nr:hypothetical protein [Thiothrix winogradskyi]UJS26050.1 hypothetical protein L2Y54_08425 [Thiothrix winogradskyi]